MLEHVLDLGHPGGFIWTFAELPKLARLLQELRKRKAQKGDKQQNGYLQPILMALYPVPTRVASKEELLLYEKLNRLLSGRFKSYTD